MIKYLYSIPKVKALVLPIATDECRSAEPHFLPLLHIAATTKFRILSTTGGLPLTEWWCGGGCAPTDENWSPPFIFSFEMEFTYHIIFSKIMILFSYVGNSSTLSALKP